MVIKVIELIGVSEKSFEEAVREAVRRATKTVKNITGVDIVGQTCHVEKGEVTEFRVNVKIAFVVEE
ncbi:MAG: dodecin family protein [Patescibacteria group bacterium]|nr:dodecin family protein [Patescibacteria group bacterium]